MCDYFHFQARLRHPTFTDLEGEFTGAAPVEFLSNAAPGTPQAQLSHAQLLCLMAQEMLQGETKI